MEWTRALHTLDQTDASVAGGKGASLGELIRAGFSVPPGFVVIASAFDHCLETNSLRAEIIARLAELRVDDMNSVEQTSTVISEVIHNITPPKELEDAIYHAYDELHLNRVAVRSSATVEDSKSASWAGELETYLNIPRDRVIDRVKQCWASLFTPRALFYRAEKDFLHTNISVAVVIQQMIPSDVSGVTFTVHPVTEDRDQMIIEAIFGLGEALVGGHVTPDSFVISKSESRIIEKHIGDQKKQLVRGEEENEWMELTEKGRKQKLSEEEVIRLSEMCQKIEDHYGFPCDIEWAYASGQLYITQSRPITTLKA